MQSRKTEKEFIEQLHAVNPDIELVGHYEKATSKVRVKCGLCGHTWDVIPGNLLNGSGCPNCNASATSFMEQVISEAFKRAVGEDKVLCRDSSAIGMELDIYIHELHFAVEPGSWRAWHKDKVERDRLKREKCAQAGIKLVSVYDNCPDSECPFEENCYSFPIDLATQKNHLELKRLVAYLPTTLASSIVSQVTIGKRSAFMPVVSLADVGMSGLLSRFEIGIPLLKC